MPPWSPPIAWERGSTPLCAWYASRWFPLNWISIQSPVFIDFLKEQLAGFESALPMAGEVRLARDFEDGLKGTLRAGFGRDSGRQNGAPGERVPSACAASLRRSGYKLYWLELRLRMLDIAYCLLIVAFFAVAWMMVQACERL